MHILFVSFAALVLLLKNVNTQQCRQVTVCDQKTTKEEKGDIGFLEKVRTKKLTKTPQNLRIFLSRRLEKEKKVCLNVNNIIQ